MQEVNSAEEIRAEHLQVFGPELGPVYNALHDEIVWLHVKWRQYKILYGDSPERVQLLNNAAGFFFRVIQDILLEDVVLHIARLTDRCETMRKENLTLLRLERLINDNTLSADVRDLVEAAETESSFAKKWRHQHLAHRDLRLALNEGVEPLPGISRENIDGALSAIRAVLNKIDAHYRRDAEFGFEHFRAHQDAESLVYHLEIAAKAEARRQERLTQGRPLPEDLEP